jgi:tagatose 1,6-diphosphate aldolase
VSATAPDSTASWTPARARAVDELAGPDGVIVGAAVDHRDAMTVALRKKGLPEPTPEELCDLKLRVARVLAPVATLVLLDAEFSAAQALAAGVIPGDTALVVPLEAQGYGDSGDLRHSSFLPGWDPAKAAALGASGCKLLLPYRPDLPEQCEHQDAVVRAAVDGCRAAGIALVLEPIVFARAGEELDGERFGALVIDTAARLAALRPEILKMQYPGSAAACADLDGACGPSVPWVLLGGGASAGELEGQIVDACRAGASGFIVGRTLFDPGLVADAAESERALRSVSVPLAKRLGAAARAYAQPWRERVGRIEAPALGWYREG